MNGMFSFLLQNVMTTGMLFNELAIMMCSNTNLTLCNYVVTTRGVPGTVCSGNVGVLTQT